MAERPSLRNRLMVLLVSGTGLLWAAMALGTFLDARYHADRMFDAQLLEYSEVLSTVAGHEAYEIAGETTGSDHEYGQTFTYQVYAITGEMLLRSHAAPLAALATANGFSDADAPGGPWRVYRRVDTENQLIVVVAHQRSERAALILSFASRMLLPSALGLPLIALVIWLAVARSLAPLDRLAAEVRGREAERLEPLVAAEAPREIEPLLEALNQLFARLERSFDNERRFTDDAAHELRTPLAALKTHAEVALTTASEERRRRSLEQVVAGVDRATRLVEQLLTLARLDAAHSGYETRVDVVPLAREALASFGEAAARRGVRLEFPDDASPLPVRGEASMLHALIRNLLENAVRHAPEGGIVRLSLGSQAGRVLIHVEDSGPGVAPELRQLIFDRHFRAPGEGGAAGLGLSIARRVVELHAGGIEAGQSEELHGLRVTVWLPLSQTQVPSDKETLSRREHSGAS